MGTVPSRYFIWGPQPGKVQAITGIKNMRYTIASTHMSFVIQTFGF